MVRVRKRERARDTMMTIKTIKQYLDERYWCTFEDRDVQKQQQKLCTTFYDAFILHLK